VVHSSPFFKHFYYTAAAVTSHELQCSFNGEKYLLHDMK